MVVDAVLLEIGDRGGALGAVAVALAAQLDDPDVPAAAKATCARSLHACLDRIRELEPPVVLESKLDELAGKRAKRRAAS